MTRAVVVIPARYGSERLPAKPLLRETGKYLIQHVYEQARQARGFADVIVATDDERIVAAVESFGGHCQLTSAEHPSGTDRVAEVASRLEPPPEIVVNLQGDEPAFPPSHLEQVLALCSQPGSAMATLAVAVGEPKHYRNPNVVKVVLDGTGAALYFSRAPIPLARDGTTPTFLKHLGVYAYRREVLERLVTLPPAPLERIERLEQLRALHHGISIRVGIVADVPGGVDTPEDYQAFVQWYRDPGRIAD